MAVGVYQLKNSRRKILLIFAAGNMELCWLYSLAAYFTFFVKGFLFPPLQAFIMFWTASLLVFLTKGRGLYIYQILIINLICFLIILVRGLYVFGYSLNYLPFYFQNLLDIAIISFVVICYTIFWFTGKAFAKRPMTYNSITNAFDKGIMIFFFFYFVTGVIGLNEPNLEFMVFPFFLFSIIGISLVRDNSSGHKTYIKGYRGVGILLSFITIVMAISSGVILLFLQYLTLAAQKGYTVVKDMTEPFYPYFENFLRFIFGFLLGNSPIVNHGAATPTELDVSFEVNESGFSSQLLAKILEGLLYLTIIILIGLFVFWFFKLMKKILLRRTFLNENNIKISSIFKIWLKKILEFCFNIVPSKESSVKKAYKKLMKWGYYSGVKYEVNETPSEYGKRLGALFPTVNSEINIIIENFNQEVYGGKIINDENIANIKQAWKRINNPRLLPQRLFNWFTS